MLQTFTCTMSARTCDAGSRRRIEKQRVDVLGPKIQLSILQLQSKCNPHAELEPHPITMVCGDAMSMVPWKSIHKSSSRWGQNRGSVDAVATSPTSFPLFLFFHDVLLISKLVVSS